MTFEEFVVAIALFLIGQYLIYYFREKGKNLATKEDIGGITHEIEDVKNQYSSDLEKFKADLQVMVRNESILTENINEALMNFFRDVTSLYYEKLTVYFGDFPVDRGEVMMEYQTSTTQLFAKISSDYYILSLYFENESEVLKSAANIVKDVQIIRKIFRKEFINYKIANRKENEAFLSGADRDLICKKADITDLKLKEYYKKLEPATETMMIHFNEYLEALKIHFNDKGLQTLIESLKNENDKFK